MPPENPSRLALLTEYDADHLARIALPLGGIGTGAVSLGGARDLRDWEIMNRPAKGFTPRDCFFALRAQARRRRGGHSARWRAPCPPMRMKARSAPPRQPRAAAIPPRPIRRRLPAGPIMLSYPDAPLDVRIEAFNPNGPAGRRRQRHPPRAVLRFVLTNRTAKTVTASVCGSVRNFIGHDGAEGQVSPQRQSVPQQRAAVRPRVAGC